VNEDIAMETLLRYMEVNVKEMAEKVATVVDSGKGWGRGSDL
jgi:hypothetical protein